MNAENCGMINVPLDEFVLFPQWCPICRKNHLCFSLRSGNALFSIVIPEKMEADFQGDITCLIGEMKKQLKPCNAETVNKNTYLFQELHKGHVMFDDPFDFMVI